MHKLTIGKKLGIGFGFMLVLFGVVIMIYHSTVHSVSSQFGELMRHEVALATHASAVESSMLQLRRNEKDFLLRRDMKYPEKLKANYATLQAEINKISQVGRQAGYLGIVRKADEMARYASAYYTDFQKVVDAWVRMGLDQNSGLQGEIQTAAHTLANILAGYDVDDLYRELLFLRRWEKDFVRTGMDRYEQRLLTTLENYKTLLEQSTLDAGIKRVQRQALAGYVEAFNVYVGAVAGDVKAQAYERMREFAREIEKSIQQVFIPDARVLLLQIRKHEKDYLLRGDERHVEKTHQAIAALIKQTRNSGIGQDAASAVIDSLKAYQKAFDALVEEKREVAVLISAMREAVHKIEPLVAEIREKALVEVETELRAVDQAAGRRTLIALVIGMAVVVIGVVVAWAMTRSVSRPLVQMAEVADRITVGDINQTVEYRSGDEVGRLAEAFRRLITYIKGVAEAAEALGRGDLTAQVETKSDQDVLSQSFARAMGRLRDMVGEIKSLIQAAKEGKLTTRGDTSRFEGVFVDVIDGVNEMLDATLAPIQEAADVLERVASRDLTARVCGEYAGDHAKIKEALNTTVANLDESMTQVAVGAEQVASAAAQISSGSQSLAQGASEQASSLEEVSSSLQELSSMSQQNAANAQEARRLADNARVSAEKGVDSMQRLSAAIDRIKTSSDETAKIVKTIDDIAFQTNLLALNAAVEAARAGDAGKGFAVVAEEVRNLAMRSAEAAKSTAQMIEEAVQNAENGVALNQEVRANLEEITKQVRRVSEVMEEIAAASEQQGQGVAQISTAVEQMNQVTQQNAANSEESASAAEELSAQAETMQTLVGTFRLTNRIASASTLRARAPRNPNKSSGLKSRVQPPQSARVLPIELQGNGHDHASSVGSEQIIPFDDDDRDVLEDF
jgi:methyl-accepting chemotaxis protein